MKKSTHRKEHPQDDIIAIQRLAIVRYFASGLIAGGAAVTLTLLLTAIDIQRQSYVALGVLNVFLLFGCIYFMNSSLRWMGLHVPRLLITFTYLTVVYQLWDGVIIHPEHTVRAFTGAWWGVAVHAVISIFIGAFFRYMAEGEIDDLEYGLDHGLGVKKLPSESKK